MYTLYYTVPDNTPDPAFMVVSEDYADIGDLLPTPGTYKVVSRNHPTEQSARDEADARQRRSYAETRKAQANG